MKKSTTPAAPKLACSFYRTAAGGEPVREWLREQPKEVKQKIGEDIRVVQYQGVTVGRPLVGMLKGGLFEVRTSHFDNDYRVFFSVHGGKMVLLHGAQKPIGNGEVELARTRKDEIDVERRTVTAAVSKASKKVTKKKNKR